MALLTDFSALRAAEAPLVEDLTTVGAAAAAHPELQLEHAGAGAAGAGCGYGIGMYYGIGIYYGWKAAGLMMIGSDPYSVPAFLATPASKILRAAACSV